MNLGEKIYTLRNEKNLSQGNLADMLDVSRQSVSKWENNIAVPDLDKIIKLSEIFGVTVDELVKENSETVLPKSDSVSTKPSFSPRIIVGTVLFSLSFIVSVLFLALGGGFSGIILSIPLILCGAVCFIFKKNVALWCAWATYFCIDVFLCFATGVNRSNIFKTLIWSSNMNYFTLFLSWIIFLALVILVLITVLKLRKVPLNNKKLPLILWEIYAFAELSVLIISKTDFYYSFITNLLKYQTLLSILFFAESWIFTLIFTAALVFTARFIYSKRA